jgi:hypothetical protein
MKIDKNIVIGAASLGVLGGFLYYYSKKNQKNYLNQTGGYGTGAYSGVCRDLASGCKTLQSCTNLKLNEIKCKIRNDEVEFNKVKAEAQRRGITIPKMLHIIALNIFSNNGTRNVKQSLAFYNILPTAIAQQQYWESFFNSPALQQIIVSIKGNSSLMSELLAKAKAENTTIDRQIKMAALKIYRQQIRDIRRQQQIQRQQNQNITVTTSNYNYGQTYIPNYGFVEVHNMTPAQFNKVTESLVSDPFGTFSRLEEGVYQVRGTSSVGMGTTTTITGGGGGSGEPNQCAGYTWGSFNWSWCRMIAGLRMSAGTGGY